MRTVMGNVMRAKLTSRLVSGRGWTVGLALGVTFAAFVGPARGAGTWTAAPAAHPRAAARPVSCSSSG
jgi:hypothetical protein